MELEWASRRFAAKLVWEFGRYKIYKHTLGLVVARRRLHRQERYFQNLTPPTSLRPLGKFAGNLR
jgi:hypothetical protein